MASLAPLHGAISMKRVIDGLIEFSKRKSLLEIVHIENEVSENLGRKVELLTEKAISPYLRERINEVNVVYNAKVPSI